MTFWDETLALAKPEWLEEIAGIRLECEARRASAHYDTGTISDAACVCLRALCERYRPTVVVEIGTFIGTSAMTMLGCDSVARVYTCDKRNGCGPQGPRVKRYSFTASTNMLKDLVRVGLLADLWFFDGRIELDDIRLIEAMSTQEAVYAFDDYYVDDEGKDQKGMINVRRWLPSVPTHSLVKPAESVMGLDSTSTIAVLVP